MRPTPRRRAEDIPKSREYRHRQGGGKNTYIHQTRPQRTPPPGAGRKSEKMSDTSFILGLATGISFRFIYDLVARHQRRKRRHIQHQQAIRNRLF